MHHARSRLRSRLRPLARAFSAASPFAEFGLGAKEAARAGAREIFERVDRARNIEFKGTSDLVTDTDKASEKAITSHLLSAFAHHAILGEEGGILGDPSSDYLWIVDPLDGTTNFTHSYAPFAVSVGLLHQDVPVAACVIEFTGWTGNWVAREWTATKGGGCYCNDVQVNVSDTSSLQNALLVTGFGYNHDEAWQQNMDFFKHFTDVTRGVRRLGAAAVDLCHVSTGQVDGYWEYNLSPWDSAAGVLMVEEAGGVVTTMDGKPYSVWDCSILAATPALHSEMLRVTLEKTAALGLIPGEQKRANLMSGE